MAESETCPSGCGRTVRYGHLMCGTCWREVPDHLQRQVLRTWRAYQASHRRKRGLDTPEDHAVIRTARLAYQDARDAAVGSIA